MIRCLILGHKWFPTGHLPICLRCTRYLYLGHAVRIHHGPVLQVLTNAAQRVVERSS